MAMAVITAVAAAALAAVRAHSCLAWLQPMDVLGSPGDWCLKGEGNANLVFAYTGSDHRLVSAVGWLRGLLRSRRRPHFGAAVACTALLNCARNSTCLCRLAGCYVCASRAPFLRPSKRRSKTQCGRRCWAPCPPSTSTVKHPAPAPIRQCSSQLRMQLTGLRRRQLQHRSASSGTCSECWRRCWGCDTSRRSSPYAPALHSYSSC